MYRIPRTVLVAASAMLLLFGISMLYSTSYTAYGESLLKKQLVWIGIGAFLATVLAWRFDYRKLGRYSWWLLGIFAALLAYLALANILHSFDGLPSALAEKLPFVAGLSVGSARWLRISVVTIQPSEFAKLAIIMFLANYFPRHLRHTHAFYRGFMKPLGAVGILIFLILLGGDLSTTVIAGCVAFGTAFVAGVRLRFLALACAAGVALGVLAISTNQERISRITSYQNPEEVQQGAGYQLWHSQLALGSGGWRGLGFTNSRMKRFYLPEAHTDFIVAITGEELGFVGVMGLVVLYICVIGAGLWIACLAADYEGTLVACGISMAVGLQALINISVVTGYFPTTGVTAPLLSYGGSSIVATLLGLGMLLNVLRIGEQEQPDEQVGSTQPAPVRLGRAVQVRFRSVGGNR